YPRPTRPDPRQVRFATGGPTTMDEPVNLPEEEWKKRLTPEQYRVLRRKGTEPAFTGAFWDSKAKGMYLCAGCGAELFDSSEKFDSGCGWPSFTRPTEGSRVQEHEDRSYGMIRTEVTCRRCG